MLVTVRNIARPIDLDTFADITAKTVTDLRWAGANGDTGLKITTAEDLTPDEVRLFRIRCASPDQATETLLRELYTAYQSNQTYLALTTPTGAQSVAQVNALTREAQLLIRLFVSVL